MWEYNSSVAFLRRLPVYSFVIYLREDDYIVEPPYQLKGVRGEVLQMLNYRNILLWEVPAEELQQTGLEGLLPLLPFSELQVLAQQLAERTMASSLLEKIVNDLLVAQTTEQARLILTEAINKPS